MYASGDDDALSRITSLHDSTGGTTLVEYTYAGLGTFVETAYPEPQITWQLTGGSDAANPYPGLDQFGRVIDCLWQGAAGPVAEIQYGYNRLGNRVWRADPVAASQTPPVYQDELYTYDDLQRLVSMSRGQLIPSPYASGEGEGLCTQRRQEKGIFPTLGIGENLAASLATPTFAQTWALDSTGNWSNFTMIDGPMPANNLDQQRTSNAVNEIKAIAQHYGAAWAQPAYDRAGNMTMIPQPTATGRSNGTGPINDMPRN
jgi:hypothetical protein